MLEVECEECALRMVKNTPAGYGEEELRSGEERASGAWCGGGEPLHGRAEIQEPRRQLNSPVR